MWAMFKNWYLPNSDHNQRFEAFHLVDWMHTWDTHKSITKMHHQNHNDDDSINQTNLLGLYLS
jgi:hypothetical protein